MRTGRPCEEIKPGDESELLTAIEPAGKDKHGRKLWRCRCYCGNETIVKGTEFRTRRIKSCGCRKTDGHANYRHGHKGTANTSRAYICWSGMKRRCNDPSLDGWKNYGGRGITYDPAWEVFETFLADMGEPPEGMSLDRRDNDGMYCKDNCRWVDRRTQRMNSRAPIRWVEINGERMTLTEAVARFSSASYSVVLSRILRGWPDLEAIMTPTMKTWKRTKKNFA